MGSGSLLPWPQRPFPDECCGFLEPPDDFGPVLLERGPVRHFPRGGWNPDLLALSVLGDFARSDWSDRIKVLAPRAFDHPDMKTEVEHLLQLWATKRAARIGEIRDQNTRFHDWFAHLLMMSPGSHFETFCLMKSAARVGEMLMVVYKLQYERPRPQQAFPRLTPLLDAPGHSSYPSGHALIGRLIALCLAQAVPHAASALLDLSARIGQNREIAGIHFPSDTQAGFEIAAQAAPILGACATYQDLLARAKPEWADVDPPKSP